MTEQPSTTPPNRRERLASRRHRTRFAIIAGVVAVLAVGIGTAAALRNRDTSSASTPAGHTRVNDAAPTAPGLGRAKGLPPPRRISHDDPMRLLVAGDSLAGSFGPALGQISGATGVVRTTIDYKVSSGLADNGIRDWYEHAQQDMTSLDPDAVVFIIGTNDASIVNSLDANNDGVPDWQVRYREKIDEMMATFVGGSRHRTVFWLGPPTLGDVTLTKGARELGALMRREAAKFAPDVVYVDTYKLFSDRAGDYSASLPDAAGDIVQMRISDGVHFTVDGARYLADDIWTLVNKRWHVLRQADPSQPITYTIEGGSGDYVPGVGRYRPQVAESTTTDAPTTTMPATTVASTSQPPTTAPVTTVPPTTAPKVTTTTRHGPPLKIP